ncbi:unnamed protein product [Symbiodinium microadriaticum]|nr:unnamed protein product [Symbiodinium microadriaticum]
MYTAELLLADAASFQHNLAKRNADEVPQAWDAFTRYITEVMGKKQTLNVSNFCRIGWKVEEGLHQPRMRPHFNISDAFAISCRADARSQLQGPAHSLTHVEEFNFSASLGKLVLSLCLRGLRDRHFAHFMLRHWYYGGADQIRTDFGGQLLSGFERSVHPFPDSIMQLSSTGGGGRGSNEGDVVGGAILHGKKEYWRRGGQYHYHHTLDAGENTLEASLVRVVLQSLRSTGRFSASDFRKRYIEFMTTPGTHNDTYASTCHRMFFQKWRAGVDPKDCPDNDGHNVDTMDGLVIPTVVALISLAQGEDVATAAALAVEALAVTRSSEVLPEYVRTTTYMLDKVMRGTSLDHASMQTSLEVYESAVFDRNRRGTDPVVACYIGGSFPALLHFAYKYAGDDAWDALLASANAGGENVHRNEVLGLLLGAAQGRQGLKTQEEGLKHYAELEEEIQAVVEQASATMRSSDL